MFEQSAEAIEKKIVLLVDDNKLSRLTCRRFLELSGYQVVEVESGRQALEQLETIQPIAVLLDFMMPGLNGPETAKLIRKNARVANVPVIMLTASEEESHIEEAFAAGADDYLMKPSNKQLIKSKIEATVRARAASLQVEKAKSALQEHDALVSELEEAQRVQVAQLPSLPATWGDWSVSGTVVSSRQIGGDMLDLVQGLDGRRIALLVDVSGHGVAAALVASSICAQLRMLLQKSPLMDAMQALNTSLLSSESGKYACIAVVEFREEEIAVINAGLPPVSLIRGGRVLQEIVASGPPVGLLSEIDFTLTTAPFLPGDRLLMVSDGLTEPFGSAADLNSCVSGLDVLSPMCDLHAQSPETISKRIQSLLLDRATDDATALIASRIA